MLLRKYNENVQQFLLLCTWHALKTKKCNSTTVQVSVGNISDCLYFSLNPWINIHYNQVNSLILGQYKTVDSKNTCKSRLFPGSHTFWYMLGLNVQNSRMIWVIGKSKNIKNSIWPKQIMLPVVLRYQSKKALKRITSSLGPET